MTDRTHELNVLAPPTLRERLTVYVAQLRERAEVSSRRAIELTAGVPAASIARELEALLEETGRGTATEARSPDGPRPGSLRHDRPRAEDGETGESARGGPTGPETRPQGAPGRTNADPRRLEDGSP